MKMQESPEDYLEAILVLTKELGNVRSIDVANYLGYSKPSISVAIKAEELPSGRLFFVAEYTDLSDCICQLYY